MYQRYMYLVSCIFSTFTMYLVSCILIHKMYVSCIMYHDTFFWVSCPTLLTTLSSALEISEKRTHDSGASKMPTHNAVSSFYYRGRAQIASNSGLTYIILYNNSHIITLKPPLNLKICSYSRSYIFIYTSGFLIIT